MRIFIYKAYKITILILVATIMMISTANSDDVLVKVHQETLGELAAFIQPIPFEGNHEEWFCNSKWDVEVTNLNFIITTSGLSLTGDINGTWCEISFYGSLDTTGDVFYRPAEKEIVVNINSAPVEIKKDIDVSYIPGWSLFVDDPIVTITLATIDATQYINIDPIPIRPAVLLFESEIATDRLIVNPADVSPTMTDEYIEVGSSLTIR